MTVYKQGQMQTDINYNYFQKAMHKQMRFESFEIQFKEKKSDGQSKQKEQQVQFLQQQIKLRDGMINEWKGIIQDGKIKNKIAYGNLRNIEDVAESVKINNGQIISTNPSPHNSSFQQSPKRRVQSQINIHPSRASVIKVKQTFGQRRSQLALQRRDSDQNLHESYSSHSIKSAKGNRKSNINSPSSIQQGGGNQIKGKRNNNFTKQSKQKYFN